jgi:pSer/pThr/pTyr-binding forkhead associated (FHA) protein
MIERRGNRAFVRDLDTPNGTKINGRLIHDEPVEVSHGDQLQIGPYRFLVSGWDSRGARRILDCVERILNWMDLNERAGNHTAAPAASIGSPVTECSRRPPPTRSG